MLSLRLTRRADKVEDLMLGEWFMQSEFYNEEGRSAMLTRDEVDKALRAAGFQVRRPGARVTEDVRRVQVTMRLKPGANTNRPAATATDPLPAPSVAPVRRTQSTPTSTTKAGTTGGSS